MYVRTSLLPEEIDVLSHHNIEVFQRIRQRRVLAFNVLEEIRKV